MKLRKEGLEDRLGAVLGRFWVVLVVVLGPRKRSRHYACRCFVKIHVFGKMRCQEATWIDLGSIWGAKRLQNGPRRGSKSELRSVELSGVELSEVELSLRCEKGG